MSNFWRTVFGLGDATGNRTVVGNADGADAKDLPFVQESNKRLVALHDLYARYKNTQQAPLFQMVYEKTKRIHAYLVPRGRVHELELFHVQHTDHFLNTYTVIMDMHQQHHYQAPAESREPVSITKKVQVVGRTLVLGPFRRDRKEVKAAHMQNRETSQRAFKDTAEANTEVPALAAPHISINTYAKLVYLREGISDGLTTNEIGFTSTPEEKQTFVTYIASRLGLSDIAYVGNTMVYLPNPSGSPVAEMVPVVHWNGSPYALSLEDYRLFPVRTFRKGR